MPVKSAKKRRRGRPPVDKSRPPKMSAADYCAWQDAMGLSDAAAARKLGASTSSIVRYREKGGSATLGLACAAVASGLPSWSRRQSR